MIALPAPSEPRHIGWAAGTLFAVVCGALLLDVPLFVYLFLAPAFLPKYAAVVLGVVAIAAGGLSGLVTGRVLALAGAYALYLALSVVALSWTPNADAAMQELVTRFTGGGIILIAAMITARTLGARQREILAILALLAVASLVLDAAQGYVWTKAPGRTAGTFGNPGIAAAATMILGVLGVRGVPARWRGVFLGIVALGVISTLARAGYVMLVLSGGALVLGGVVDWRSLRRGFLVLGIGGALLLAVVSRTPLADRPELALLQALDPITLLRLKPGDASSASERKEVAVAAIELFNEAPLLGAGITATSAWTLPVSTHNQILRVAAELGVVGVMTLLIILGTVVVSGRLWRTPEGIAAMLWLLVLVGVSHNVLEDWSHLASMGVLTALGAETDGPPTPSVPGAAHA